MVFRVSQPLPDQYLDFYKSPCHPKSTPAIIHDEDYDHLCDISGGKGDIGHNSPPSLFMNSTVPLQIFKMEKSYDI